MKALKIGLIREEKIPNDTRVAFSPQQCIELKKKFPQFDLTVQPSPRRCFKDNEYLQNGIEVKEDLSGCDLLIGIKEIPAQFLIAGKSYLLFSHTIKKQPHNRNLLQAVLAKNIRLIDYECLADKNGKRLVGFGHFAGVIGAHNGLLTWGKRYGLFNLKPANRCNDYNELTEQYKHITLPPVKIAVTGTGRVGKGVAEFLDHLHIKRITPEQLLKDKFNEPVYAIFTSRDLFRNKLTHGFDRSEFHSHPELYESIFLPYTEVTDLVMNAIFWNPAMPQLFTKNNMKSSSFKIKVIADISCDINGSMPATIRYATIEDPVFGYDPKTEQECAPYSPSGIDVMAVSNLPNELPREASIEFGDNLVSKVMGEFLKPHSSIIQRAIIAENGRLTPNYEYLTDYVLTTS
jgi:saccharopine dehydrogenase (NAD+, L-lysine forming)